MVDIKTLVNNEMIKNKTDNSKFAAANTTLTTNVTRGDRAMFSALSKVYGTKQGVFFKRMLNFYCEHHPEHKELAAKLYNNMIMAQRLQQELKDQDQYYDDDTGNVPV